MSHERETDSSDHHFVAINSYGKPRVNQVCVEYKQFSIQRSLTMNCSTYIGFESSRLVLDKKVVVSADTRAVEALFTL